MEKYCNRFKRGLFLNINLSRNIYLKIEIFEVAEKDIRLKSLDQVLYP